LNAGEFFESCPSKVILRTWENELFIDAGRNRIFAANLLLKNGAPGGIRTHDQLIKSQLLYQLSYRGDPENIIYLVTKADGKFYRARLSKDSYRLVGAPLRRRTAARQHRPAVFNSRAAWPSSISFPARYRRTPRGWRAILHETPEKSVEVVTEMGLLA
jgi:hypothetical protein